MGPEGFLAGPGVVMLPRYEALAFFNQRLYKILPGLLYLQLWLKSEAVKATLVSSWDLTRRIRDFSQKIIFCFPSTALPLILGGLAPLWAGGHAGSFWS